MSEPHICPSCSCLFHQDFVCTTCGAEKLYDETVKQLRERCAFYEKQNAEQGKLLNAAIAERDDYRAALERYCDDKCNAEYNPCEARKILAKYPKP